MTPENTIVYKTKKHAAEMLTAKLKYHDPQKCSVIAITNGALPIASFLANHLRTNLTVLPLETIKGPAGPQDVIGEASFEFAITDDISRDIPQDYLLHQGRILQSKLISTHPDTYLGMNSMIKDKWVILVAHVTKNSHKLIACVEYVRKKQPEKLFAIVPVITLGVKHAIASKVDELFINQLVSQESVNPAYTNPNTIHPKSLSGYRGANSMQ